MSKKKTYRSCEICGIREAHLKEPLFFANFPVDEIRCREWVKVTGNEDLVYLPIEKLHTSKHVCGHHFTKNDFNRKGNRLKKHVVPSINLNKPLSDDQLSEFPLHLWKPEVSAAVDEPSTSKAHTDTMLDPQTKRNTLSIAVAVDEPSTSKVHFDSILSPTKEENIVSIAASMDPVTQPSASEVLSDTTTIARVTGQVTKPLVTTSSASTILKSENSYGVKRKIEEKEVLTPRKKKLIEKLKNTTCTLKSLKRSALIVENIKSPVLKELILNACKNEKVKPRGRRWTLKHKLSCLAILKRSPKAYRYLSASLPLPTIKTLQNILKKIPIQPGICKPALNRIKKLAETQEDNDNIALLVFDEMAIKSRLIYDEANDVVEGFEDYGEYGRTNELADHALVFLLQGLKKKFKQPIAHYFTKGTVSSQKLAMLVKNIINEVTACGIRVMGIICDQGPTNMGAIKLLTKNNRSEEGGGHFFEIEDKRVYIIYDIPHLFKSIRNNFMNAGTIIMDKKKGNWALLKEVEIHNRNFLYLSKITESHVKPKYKAKMKVKLAAQLLSNTVAAVLKLLAMADTNRKEELLETAHIVQELDKLFDVSNGPSGPSDIKKTIRENVSKKTNHVIKWNESIQLLRNTKFVKNGEVCKNIKCIDGYIISLKSYKDIWNELQKSGLKYLNLRNLNQDGLENLFGIIRQSSPTNKNPTATHFSSSLKTAIITGMTAPHSRGANCEKDKKRLLINFHDVVFPQDDDGENPNRLATNETTVVSSYDVSEDRDDWPSLHLPDEDELMEVDFTLVSEQPTVYVAGYLARQILKNINCEICKENLTVEDPQENPIYKYIFLREWWENKFHLTYPTLQFCMAVKSLIEITENELIPHLHRPDICLLGCTLYRTQKYESFSCHIHGEELADVCYKKACKLLIRRQCQIINRNLVSKEENLASINKLAEQQGKAK